MAKKEKKYQDEDQTKEGGEKKNGKPFWKKWWFWLIIIVVLVASCSGSGSDEEDATTETGSAAIEQTAEDETDEGTEEEEEAEAEEDAAVTYSIKASDTELDFEFKEATEEGVTFTATGTAEGVQLVLTDASIEVDGETYYVEYNEEADEYESEVSILADGDDEGYMIYIEEGETVDLTFYVPDNPEFDSMVITYDCSVRGVGLDLTTELYEYEDVTMKITKD